MEKYLCDGKVTLYARQPCGNQRSSSRSEVVEKNEKLCTSGDRKGNEEYCDVTRSRKRNGKMGERRPVEALLASISTSIQLKSDSTSEIFESGDSTDAYYRRKAQHVQVESSSQVTKNNEQKRVDVTRSFTHALTNDLKSSQSSEISEKENKRDVYLLETTGRTTNETDCSRTVEEKQTRHIKRNISGESRHLQGKDNQVKLSTCSSSGIKANAKVIELTKIENCASVDQNVDDGWIFESLGETPKANQVERSEREGVDIEKLLEELEKERMKLVDDRKQMEESLARDKKQLAANLYTLLVTARHQIGQLNTQPLHISTPRKANSVLKCPSCSHIFSTSKNCVKPKYTRVLKGRNTIELCFENFDELKRWLSLNNMERDADGFPVLPEPQATQPTLHSTNSLILAASVESSSQVTKNNEQKRVDVTRSFTHALTNDLKSSQSSEISEKENKRDVYLLETTGRTTNETDCSRTVEEKQTRHIKRNISGESRHLQGKDNQVKLSTCSSSGIKANAKVIELTKIENCASVDQNVDDGWIFESLGETPKANQVERSEREGVDIEKLLEELEKERMKLVDDRKQMEESLARDKKQLAANLYTLLVTARHQIGQLNADKKSLMNK
ncbi:hypothetical protein Tcan_15747 [Toxocara canis]|uniref:Uncharacterized protein n=1 Tax=Toxocara canis TaxID=6265 RepID=A0A0B2V9H2_TOXCA|nr:hypothetical protein Tcan_15747 [Toxocara canis]